MNEDRKNYYRLAEAFDTLIPKALSQYLEKAMTGKPVAGYQHKAGWWDANVDCLSRARLSGMESVDLQMVDPPEWRMNLLVKVIKYCNYDLLERYGKEWTALDRLIEIRAKVLAQMGTRSVSDGQDQFKLIFSELTKFRLENIRDILAEKNDLEKKEPTEEEGGKFHKALDDQRSEWEEFVGRLYERGGRPRRDQLSRFISSQGKQLNIIQTVAAKYAMIAAFLIQDDDGTRAQGMLQNRYGNVVNTTDEIFSTWLQEPGATWDRLVKCLRYADYNHLAKQVDDSLV
jgi:hypothetical protein